LAQAAESPPSVANRPSDTEATSPAVAQAVLSWFHLASVARVAHSALAPQASAQAAHSDPLDRPKAAAHQQVCLEEMPGTRAALPSEVCPRAAPQAVEVAAVAAEVAAQAPPDQKGPHRRQRQTRNDTSFRAS